MEIYFYSTLWESIFSIFFQCQDEGDWILIHIPTDVGWSHFFEWGDYLELRWCQRHLISRTSSALISIVVTLSIDLHSHIAPWTRFKFVKWMHTLCSTYIAALKDSQQQLLSSSHGFTHITEVSCKCIFGTSSFKVQCTKLCVFNLFSPQ